MEVLNAMRMLIVKTTKVPMIATARMASLAMAKHVVVSKQIGFQVQRKHLIVYTRKEVNIYSADCCSCACCIFTITTIDD